MKLVQELRHLDRRALGAMVMLGPPMPKTAKQKLLWNPPGDPMELSTPILDKWEPPIWVPRRDDGGFWLAQNVACFQRGYEPKALYGAYLDAAAVCFNQTHEEGEEGLSLIAFDFFLAVVTAKPLENVAAGCVVELRPAINPTQAACLFICTLCTHPKYGGNGIAHQLVHAVYTLGMLLLEQNRAANNKDVWQDAIPSQNLYLGLNVHRNEDESNSHTKLIHMYSQCGFNTHGHNQVIKCKSFTSFSIFDWQFDSDPFNMIPMWKDVSVSVLYEDDSISILKPDADGGRAMYHAFPEKLIAAVKSLGIVNTRHACLLDCSKEEGKYDTAYMTQSLIFTHTPSLNSACFCINARHHENKEGNDVLLHISVPFWFASKIIGEKEIRGLNAHRGK